MIRSDAMHPTDLALKTRQGALCEYTVVPAGNVVSRPDNVTPIQAAGISLTCMTAYQSLFNIAKLEEGQTVFINGGSTAVGTYAIQMAKARGINVVATASGKNEEYVKKAGADQVCFRNISSLTWR